MRRGVGCSKTPMPPLASNENRVVVLGVKGALRGGGRGGAEAGRGGTDRSEVGCGRRLGLEVNELGGGERREWSRVRTGEMGWR